MVRCYFIVERSTKTVPQRGTCFKSKARAMRELKEVNRQIKDYNKAISELKLKKSRLPLRVIKQFNI